MEPRCPSLKCRTNPRVLNSYYARVKGRWIKVGYYCKRCGSLHRLSLHYGSRCFKPLEHCPHRQPTGRCGSAFCEYEPDVKEMLKEEAEKIGALAFFKEKYGKVVKVYFIGNQSPVSIE
ncbi:MAG: hypothetical protein ACK4TI_02315, partial [Nitrososphaerales archaeon]